MATRSYGNERKGTIALRVSDAERLRLVTEAEAAGMSVSDYARTRLFGEESSSLMSALANYNSLATSVEKRLFDIEEAIRQGRSAVTDIEPPRRRGRKGA